MKVLFDTNVIIDAVTERYSNSNYSQKLLRKAVSGEIDGYICSNQFTDIYYILRNYGTEKDRKQVLKTLSETMTVLPLLPSFVSY